MFCVLTFLAHFFKQDLKNAKSIVDWIALAEPQYDFNPMIDEWCKEAPKSLISIMKQVVIYIYINKLFVCTA